MEFSNDVLGCWTECGRVIGRDSRRSPMKSGILRSVFSVLYCNWSLVSLRSLIYHGNVAVGATRSGSTCGGGGLNVIELPGFLGSSVVARVASGIFMSTSDRRGSLY